MEDVTTKNEKIESIEVGMEMNGGHKSFTSFVMNVLECHSNPYYQHYQEYRLCGNFSCRIL